MKTYKQMVSEAAENVSELYPWDVEEIDNPDMMVLDIRCLLYTSDAADEVSPV